MISEKLNWKIFTLAFGIFVSYTLFGILQERIFRVNYELCFGLDKTCAEEKFTFPIAFVAFQCIVYMIITKGMMIVQSSPSNQIHQKFHFLVAIFYVAAMVASNMALEYIPYTTLVVGKLVNIIFTIMFGLLIVRKPYPARKYFFVLIIIVGIGLFMYENTYDVKEHRAYLIGLSLIAFSALMNGLEEAVYGLLHVPSNSMQNISMFYVNLWSLIILAPVLVLTGEVRDVMEFYEMHPNAIWHLVAATLCGSIGQVLTISAKTNFDSLPLRLTTATRKLFNVLLSVFVFGNKLITRQWIATAITFSTLLIDSVFDRIEKPREENIQEDDIR